MSIWLNVIVPLFLITTTTEASIYVAPDTAQPQAVAVRFFSAYNQVIGMSPRVNVSYRSQDIIQRTLEDVPLGFLRYPGGVIANYWNISGSNTVSPCELGAGGGKAKEVCRIRDEVVSSFPSGTISVENFVNYIAEPWLVGSQGTKHVVFDMNLLTMNTGDGLYEAVDSLLEQVGGDPQSIQFMELGNEFYLKEYSPTFPNASIYMREKALPFAAYVKRKIGDHVSISVPGAFGSRQDRNNYNADLNTVWNSSSSSSSNNKTSLISHVTFHDYSAGIGWAEYGPEGKYPNTPLSDVPDIMVHELLAYGEKTLPQMAATAKADFPAGTRIFITEFDVTLTFPVDFSRTALRAQFILNYQTAGFCRSSHGKNIDDGNADHVFDMTVLWQMWIGVNETSSTVAIASEQKGGGTEEVVLYSAVTQLLSHVGSLGLKRNSYAACLKFPEDREGCLTGVKFFSSAEIGSETFYVSNMCSGNQTIHLQVGNAKESSMATVWSYLHTHTWGWTNYHSSCEGPLWNTTSIVGAEKPCRIKNPPMNSVKPTSGALIITLEKFSSVVIVLDE